MTKLSNFQDFEVPCFQLQGFADAGRDGIVHGFFGRRGGVSEGLYESLNCGPGSGDDLQKVMANRARVANVIGAAPEKLLSVHQVHGAACVKVAAPWDADKRPQGDVMVTDRPGIALSVLTADCAPVLFQGWAGEGKPVIGAAHAGWRGAFGGALEAAVDVMVGDYGAELSTIRAAIGPCIQKKSYEVSNEFFQTVTAPNEEHERFFQASRKPGHFMFDLPGYCAFRLFERGLTQVLIHEADTYADEKNFFSYRRTTHRAEKAYGRQISVVMIGPAP